MKEYLLLLKDFQGYDSYIKNVSFDALDDTVNKYSNAVHRTIENKTN